MSPSIGRQAGAHESSGDAASFTVPNDHSWRRRLVLWRDGREIVVQDEPVTGGFFDRDA